MRALIFRIVIMLLVIPALAAAQARTTGAADIGAGKKRAAVCFACHNADGISRIPGTPHLAGQERTYLENALKAYRDGQGRQNPTMTAMAKPLSDIDISNIAAYFSLQGRMNNGQTAELALQTLERIRPVATVSIEESTAPTASAVRSGESIYGAVCMACHASGAAGAPKLADKTVWSGRLAQGAAALHQHALEGLNAMPPKGGCASCSDAEIKLAVDYMIGKAK